MKQQILEISDSNMAGYSWCWKFYLVRTRGATYSLSCSQIVNEDRPMRIDPVKGLRHGIDVFEALEGLVSDAGYSLEDHELSSIADEIAKVDRALAEEFRGGPVILEQRIEAELAKVAAEREAALGPYRETIDKYVATFSDAPLRYPGGSGYGTPRDWARHFIEDYVVANGRLPTGVHYIRTSGGGAGYSGPAHDFSDLKLES